MPSSRKLLTDSRIISCSDMATPALLKFGSDELKRQFLLLTIAGDVVACIGVSEVGAGSDRRSQ